MNCHHIRTWRTNTTARKIRAWQFEQIVFFPPSGETHYLNPCAAAILESVGLEAASTEKIHQGLNISPCSSASMDEVQSILEHLHERGLVEDI
jgi:hypothetical protein